MAALPYITAPGNIDKALEGIKAAATPERVSQDFVKTILKIKGGSGDQVTSFLKKIGFANSDGTPSKIYTRFRNNSTSGFAAAEALRLGYAPLYKRNEFMHELDDQALKGLIIEETGQEKDSSVVNLVFTAIKTLKKFASWEKEANAPDPDFEKPPARPLPRYTPDENQNKNQGNNLGLNLSYTINLNLPATSDIAVFNAIFKSLKDNLLKNEN